MALSTPSESPAVVVKEIDLTGGVPNVQSTTGAIVGNFRWGPIGKRVAIANEAELVSNFATPDSDNTIDWHSANYFLRYSSSLLVAREATAAAKNAYSIQAQGARPASFVAPFVKNEDEFDIQKNALDSDAHTFVARYPGELGNSISVEILPAVDSAGRFTNWSYAPNFDGAPGTSDFATSVNAANDEMHVVVIDQEGVLTGTRGSVLETYPYVSGASNAKTADGSTNFVLDILNTRSKYIYMVDFDADFTTGTAATAHGQPAISGSDYQLTSPTHMPIILIVV